MTTFFLGWLTFFTLCASPGPSVFAIMGTSLAQGRSAGMRLAAGVTTGSVFWGVVSATGVAMLLQTVGWALTALKIAGGLYLLWLAFKAARAATRKSAPPPKAPRAGFYAAGLALHLTNPKAVFSWSATVAVGLPAGAGASDVATFLLGCAILAVCVNFGYALTFSTAPLVRGYASARRWIEGAFAAVFAAAGIGLLLWRPARAL